MEVVNINKDKTEHGQMWKGDPVHLDFHRYKKGYMFMYYINCSIQPFGEAGPNVPHTHVLCNLKLEYRWWHKLWCITEEKRIATGVALLKSKWEKLMVELNQFDSLKESYGIEEPKEK